MSSSEVRGRAAIVGSALWAAWGDALGFITELTDASGVRARLGAEHVETTVPWRRRVGGRFGPTVDLPAGTYSDDTQLRLAVARAIRSDGDFDVEAFAKVELTVWPSYALGGGRASRAAASNLARRAVSWSSNFFDERGVRYLESGGNGAAMRIQPHVWAAPEHAPEAFLAPVILDAVVTHGHPRGILGAAFHALCLSSALRTGDVPGPQAWEAMLSALRELPRLIESQESLELWVPVWTERGRADLKSRFDDVISECEAHLRMFETAGRLAPEHAYEQLIQDLELRSPAARGSGTRTAFMSAFAAWLFRDRPADAIRVSANALGTDTDTLATLAGAILGAVCGAEPPGPIADRPYIIEDAERLWRIRNRESVGNHPYPDLLQWKPPRAQLDAAGSTDRGLAIAGLGPAEPVSSEYALRGNEDGIWQWVELWFGQSLLVKRRRDLAPLADFAIVPPMNREAASLQPVQTTLLDERVDGLQGRGAPEAVASVVPGRLSGLARKFAHVWRLG